MNNPVLDAPYWSQDAAALSAALGSAPGGLSSEQAAEKLRLVGPNSVEDASQLSALRLLLRQFESPLVLILIFAAAISLVLQQWVDSAIILAIVIGSTLLGFFQEYRASTAVAQLKHQLALTCRVMRDGVELMVPVSTVVPGDLILLSAGNLIPADGRVIEAVDFLVSEASMTGESFPVEKQPGTVKPEAALAARTNAVFLGASVQSGTAKVLVVETGLRTAFGAIAARLRARQAETDFGRGVRQFGYLLIRAMVVIVLFVLIVNLLLGRPVIESVLFAVALAVGLSPELLPAIVSVTLSAGARVGSKRVIWQSSHDFRSPFGNGLRHGRLACLKGANKRHWVPPIRFASSAPRSVLVGHTGFPQRRRNFRFHFLGAHWENVVSKGHPKSRFTF